VWDADRVAVRISPSTQFNAMSDSDPAALFGHVATLLDGYGPAYLRIILPLAYASRSRCRVRWGCVQGRTTISCSNLQ
jgi:hypothetical protein